MLFRSAPAHAPPALRESDVAATDRRPSYDDLTTWIFEPGSFAPMGKMKAGQQYSIVTDHLGTPVGMFDAQGKKVWSMNLSIYGEVRHVDGWREACPFRYPGQYEDVETGLYYNRFRYYDPEGGIYLSQDPIGLQGGTNLYGYVKDTLTWTDFLGLNALSNDTVVVRGGTCTAERFEDGSGVTTDENGKLQGVSVQSSANKSAEELAEGVKNNQYGTTTVGAIRALGGDVVASPNDNNPDHATLSGITSEQAESLFTPTKKKPKK